MTKTLHRLKKHQSDHLHTLNLHMDDVVAVLDAALNLAAKRPRVTGAQLRYHDGSICRVPGVAQQLNSVQVTLADSHLPLQGHQDGCDFLFGDKAPLDAMRKRDDGWGSGVWDSVVLHGEQRGLTAVCLS